MTSTFSKWIDTNVDASTEYVLGTSIWSLEVPLNLKITKLFFYLSNDGDIAIYNGNDKVFPSEDYFSAVGVLVKIDLNNKEALEYNRGDYLKVWVRNRSGSTLRIIVGLVGYYE